MEPRTYKVTKIDGDYAHLLNVDTGRRSSYGKSAFADETDEGTRLHWENFHLYGNRNKCIL